MMTQNPDEIEQLNKSEWWKLMGICCKISIMLYKKSNEKKAAAKGQSTQGFNQMNANGYQTIQVRKTLNKPANMTPTFYEQFCAAFRDTHLPILLQTHINILMSSRGQFVGTKSLSLSIKLITLSLRFKTPRALIKPFINDILTQISLPMFKMTQSELGKFENDPIEYVRLQNDNNHEFNYKHQMAILVEKICSLKYGKSTDKLNLASAHLDEYM
jgi:hypothetical protein